MNHADTEVLLKLKQEVDNCPKCHGTDLTCDCYRAYYFVFKIINARIPIKYRSFTLKDINQPASKPIVKRISAYLNSLEDHVSKGIGLYLCGNPGTSKTVLGCIVLTEAIRKGYSCYFATVDQYKNAIFEKDNELLDKIRTSTFLMLDDVGREYHDAKGFLDSTLDELIRIRADSLLPTVITTNYKDEGAINSFRFSSILKEHFITILFDTSDYRKKIQESLQDEEKKKSKKI